MLLGDISEREPGNIFAKNKDLSDIERFLSSDSRHFLVAMARAENLFAGVKQRFPNQTLGLWNLPTTDLIEAFTSFPALWLPIPRDSAYATGIFSSTIALAVAFRRTLIMPRHLADIYGLTTVAVVYEESILEVDLDVIDHATIRRRTEQWERARGIQNAINFLHCLTTTCS
jgi:hypothetical protein